MFLYSEYNDFRYRTLTSNPTRSQINDLYTLCTHCNATACFKAKRRVNAGLNCELFACHVYGSFINYVCIINIRPVMNVYSDL